MRTHEIVTRIYAGLGNNTVYHRAEEIVQCANEAALLLVLLKPNLLATRVLMSAVADQVFFDLKEEAPDLLRCDGITVGDTREDTPVASQGILRHLRYSTLQGLRAQRDWLTRREQAPRYYARYGQDWLLVTPRAVLDHSLTLMYRAKPTTLVLDQPNVIPNLPEPTHGLIVEVGLALALMKDGSGVVEEAMALLQRVFGREPLEPLRTAVAQAMRRSRALQGAA